jgi:hypothetical protein
MKTKRKSYLPVEVADAFNKISGEPQSLRDSYMLRLVMNGWTHNSVAVAAGDLSRERVRQCVHPSVSDTNPYWDYVTTHGIDSLPVPDLPDRIEKPRAAPRPMPSDETLARLRELKPLAAEVRFNHSHNRAEAEEYVGLIWHAHTVEGVSVYRLGKLLDVLPCGIESRLVRYGYKKTNGGSEAFSPIKYRKV